MSEYVEFPRVRYTADGPVTVENQAEMDALDCEHFDLPSLENLPKHYNPASAHEDAKVPSGHVHHEYPKMMADQQTVVENEAEETAWREANGDKAVKAKAAVADKEDDADKVKVAAKPVKHPEPAKAKPKAKDADDLI